jgi:hypothetical protein
MKQLACTPNVERITLLGETTTRVAVARPTFSVRIATESASLLRADEKVTAFLELESAVHAIARRSVIQSI